MSKRYANPLGLDGVSPEEVERLSRENEGALLTRPRGAALASMPLAGPLRNPGFEVVPWVARPELSGNLGMYCPKHLQVYSEVELEEAHYPHAIRRKGECVKFCWACGRPVRQDGLSGMGHRGSGKPCPACGFKRKKTLSQKQQDALGKGQALLRQAREEGFTGGTEVWARVQEIAPKDGVAAEKRARKELRAGQNAAPTLTELMRMKAHERAERIMRPYFESLDLDARDDWSPSTKLEFYNGQTAIAEKLLNRLEGLPVARHRHVDKDDDDVIPEGELSPRVVARLVASILAGRDPGELVEDAEFEEVGTEEDAA